MARERRQGRRYDDSRYVLRIEVRIPDVDAQTLEHAFQTLPGEWRVGERVSGAVETNHQTVTDEQVVSHAFERRYVFDSRCGLCRPEVREGGSDDQRDADDMTQVAEQAHALLRGGRRKSGERRGSEGHLSVTNRPLPLSQMGRFETELLASDENFAALTDLSGVWIDKVHDRRPPKMIILDMDSSVSPTHGEQEGTAYNGHFGCSCYHPLFVFNQFGDLERCALRPGNVHSADDWEGVLKPVVVRYKGRKVRLYFRGDAAFAAPEMYEYLEAEGFLYAIRLPKNQVLQESVAHLLTRPVGRPPNQVLRFYASFSYRAGSWDKKRRVVAKVEWHPGELVPRVGFIVTKPVPFRRAGDMVLQSAGQSGAIHQGRQERDQMDPIVVPQVPRQCRSAAASCPRL